MNEATETLSNIPLRWMIEQIIRAGVPILFDNDAFAWWGILGKDIHGKDKPLPQRFTSIMSKDVYALDDMDSLQVITDQLSLAPLWWLLEVWPTSFINPNARTRW